MLVLSFSISQTPPPPTAALEAEEEDDDPGGGHVPVEGEPDFIETHCHWAHCSREFDTQDDLVKVGTRPCAVVYVWGSEKSMEVSENLKYELLHCSKTIVKFLLCAF